jgi:tetratricopeptide (TPR) repeat protein
MNPAAQNRNWAVALWLTVFGTSVFLWPGCDDRYLSPRFLFLSAALLLAFWSVRHDLRLLLRRWPWHWLDVLLLVWYSLNLASVAWAHRFSEGIFYAQKTLLLMGAYVLVRCALISSQKTAKQHLSHIFTAILGVHSVVLTAQLAWAAWTSGDWGNETLYRYASGLSGNKSLAAEWLVLGLFSLGLFAPASRKRTVGIAVWALALVVLLQVRTAYLAFVLGALFLLLALYRMEPVFRAVFWKKIPVALGLLSLAVGLLWWKGDVSRLNPLRYIDSDTANERRFVWYKTDLLNQDHYWWGVGNGSWKIWLPSKSVEGGYRQMERNVVFTRAHNDCLEIRAEMGMVGAVLFAAIFFAAFWALASRLLASERAAAWALAGLTAYCVTQYFDFPRERIEFQLLLGIFLAASVGERGKTMRGHWAGLWFGAVGLGLLCNLVPGWARVRGEVHFLRLLRAQEQKQWHKVVSEAQKAENRWYEYSDAAMPVAWHEGIAHYQLGDIPAALAAFERAHRLNPWSFQVVHNYASALTRQKQYEQAAPLFEKALYINPRYDEGKFNLAYLYAQRGEPGRASEWLNKIDTVPNPGNDADRAKNKATLQKLQEFRAAIEALQEK